jgi:uncharacterized protein
MLLTAIISGGTLGFLGSLHCLGMCGPLLLSMPQGRRSKWGILGRKSLYHLSRAWVYGLMGLLVGWLGRGLEKVLPAQFHAWISIGSGLMLLVGFFVLPKLNTGTLGLSIMPKISALTRSHHWASEVVMGMLNALLPCGLVYVALAMALGMGTPFASFLLMLSFGLGTTPALLGCSCFAGWVNSRSFIRGLPIKSMAVGLCSGLLIVRGLGLGIPYLSPSHGILNSAKAEMRDCCSSQP